MVSEAEPVSLAPYQRFERGLLQQFFDPTSTSDKGRFRVHDARHFLVSTIITTITTTTAVMIMTLGPSIERVIDVWLPHCGFYVLYLKRFFISLSLSLSLFVCV